MEVRAKNITVISKIREDKGEFEGNVNNEYLLLFIDG